MSDSDSPVPPPPPPPIYRANPVPPIPSLPPVATGPARTSAAPPPLTATGRKGRSWVWWGLGLCVLLIGGGILLSTLSVVGKVGRLGRRQLPGAAELTEVVLEDHRSIHKIAVIPVEGAIMSSGANGSMVDLIKNQLERAAEDSAVKAVVLRIDSPGGEVLASDEIAAALREFQDADGGKPVIVSMQSLCASGGYYISAPCRWLVAHELTITGSIGVIFHGFNYRGLMDKLGVRPKVTKSGKLKDMWSPDKLPEEELPEEGAIMKELVDESFTRFKKVIREGREQAAEQNKAWAEQEVSAGRNVDDEDEGQKLGEDWESMADGRVLSGTKAKEYGFVDELGDFHVAVNRAQRIVGIKNADLVVYEAPPSFPGLFRLLGNTDVKSVKLDLGDLGGFLPKLPQGRLYFMSPVFLH